MNTAKVCEAVEREHIAPERLKVVRNSRQICPCLSMKALHIGACMFAATSIGGYFLGIPGAIAGAILGLAIGIAVIIHQAKNPN